MTQAPSLPGELHRHAGPRLSLLYRAIHGNWFYFLSAALMLLGARLLMRSPALEGSEFGKTFKALLVLQAYEMLIIWTALVIVRRLKSLNDAFYLLLIELVLLLDPTFFSNAIATFLASDGLALPLAVNLLCLVLAPLKLHALQQGLKLQFSAGAWAALLLAASCAYLGQIPLTPTILPGGHRSQEYYQYCYLLAWAPFLFAGTLPMAARLARPANRIPGLIEESRLAILGRCLLWAPIVILIAHFFETIRVHQISFFAAYLAPVPLILAVVSIKNKRGSAGLLAMVDVFCAIALALSSNLFNAMNMPSKAIRAPGISQPPDFIVAHIPLALAGIIAAGLYLYAFLATKRRGALARIGLLASGAAGWGLVRSGAPQLAAEESSKLLSVVGATLLSSLASSKAWLATHPLVGQFLILAALLALAWRFRTIWTSLIAGGYAIWLVAGWLPLSRLYWSPEIFQAWLLLAVALEFGFKTRAGRMDQIVAGAMAGAIGLARLGVTEAAWPYLPVAFEFVFFAVAGLASRRRALLILAAAQAWLTAEVSMMGAGWSGDFHAILYGLVLFAVGAWVTFNKERALEWVAGGPGSHGLGDAAPARIVAEIEAHPRPPGDPQRT